MAETFCELLEKAIIDEKEAIKGYSVLIREISPPEDSTINSEDIDNLILKPIKKDEEKHLEILEELNRRICK